MLRRTLRQSPRLLQKAGKGEDNLPQAFKGALKGHL